MKNALILHGTGNDSQGNWFPWLSKELEKKNWKIWVPNLPQANKPNIDRYNKFIFSKKDWQFNQNSIIIGHSSGAVAILGLLQALPENIKVDTCILIGTFNNNLNRDDLKDLFLKPFDWEKIKTKVEKFIFIHSDDDPHCPLDHAKFQSKKLNGKLIIKKGQKHFSISTAGPKYKKFPFLLELI